MGKFSDGFVFTLHKEFFLQEVTDIARYLGYQETQLSIVPALTSLVSHHYFRPNPLMLWPIKCSNDSLISHKQ